MSVKLQPCFTLLFGLFQHEVAVEGETGKVYRADFQDREGRSVLVLRPGKQVWQ